MCALVQCEVCAVMAVGRADFVSDVTQSMARLQLQRHTDAILACARRDGTMAVHRRAHATLLEYASYFRTVALPAEPMQLAHWVAWMVTPGGRNPTLSATTVSMYVGVVSDWHQVAAEVTGLPLLNPCRSSLMRTLMRSALANFTKVPNRKEPFTAEQVVQVLHRGFNLGTVGGRHNRLLFCFLLLGPLRPNAATGLTVEYRLVPDPGSAYGLRVEYLDGSQVRVHRGLLVVTIERDKNVDAARRREVEIPSEVFGMDVPGDLERYLKLCSPPSGGFLFSAAKAPAKQVWEAAPQTFAFNKNAYSASCAMVRRAFQKAFPDAEQWEVELFGGGSPRKTLAQLLWAVHHNRRIVVDFGGWSKGKDEAAVDSYFHTTPEQRCRFLRSLAGDLVQAQELSAETAALCEDMP